MEQELETEGEASTVEDTDRDGELVAVLDNVFVRERLRVRTNVTVLDSVGDVGVGEELGLALFNCEVDEGDGVGVDVADSASVTILLVPSGIEIDLEFDSVIVCASIRCPTRRYGRMLPSFCVLAAVASVPVAYFHCSDAVQPRVVL